MSDCCKNSLCICLLYMLNMLFILKVFLWIHKQDSTMILLTVKTHPLIYFHIVPTLYTFFSAFGGWASVIPSRLCPNGGCLLREQWMDGHEHTGRAADRRTRTPPGCSIHLDSGCRWIWWHRGMRVRRAPSAPWGAEILWLSRSSGATRSAPEDIP